VAHDPTDTALLDADALAADEASEALRQLEIGDFKWVVSNKRGRRYVYRLLELAGVFRASFTPDPYVTAFNEGRRSYGLQVLADLVEHAPESYALMLSEHNARSDRTS
jgi:hypothetical protein